jgi:hypothetical protein
MELSIVQHHTKLWVQGCPFSVDGIVSISDARAYMVQVIYERAYMRKFGASRQATCIRPQQSANGVHLQGNSSKLV